MYTIREYSDFAIASFDPAFLRETLTRRHLFVLGSAAVCGAALAPYPAGAQWGQIARGVVAAMGVISNVHDIAGMLKPKIDQFFGSGNSAVAPPTVDRITNEIHRQLQNPQVKAVSIADNRTPMVQQGNIQHSFDQDFKSDPAYRDWCVCNAQLNERAAEYWEAIAYQARARGDFAAAQRALTIAGQDHQNARMFMSKLDLVTVPPMQVAVPPGKPMLTALVVPPAVSNVLDEGDYFVTHAEAQVNRDSGVTRLA